ncbi:MAG: alpha/beta fold hydrolase, partial [Nocardioidaceae bacterium]
MTAAPLFSEQWGTGLPVAFLHGLGASARYWQQVRAASTGYRGVAPDLLGFGRSPAPPDAAYDVDAHLDALSPLVPAGSVVVGHSTGALLAVALAARRPDLVRRLLLLGLPAFPDERTARDEVGRLGLLARLTVAGSPMARVLCTAMCALRPLAIAVAPLVIRDLPPSIASDAARHTWISYHRTLEEVVVGYRPDRDLLDTPAPVTFLHGTEDRTAPPVH